jgi:hypothetical protein
VQKQAGAWAPTPLKRGCFLTFFSLRSSSPEVDSGEIWDVGGFPAVRGSRFKAFFAHTPTRFAEGAALELFQHPCLIFMQLFLQLAG